MVFADYVILAVILAILVGSILLIRHSKKKGKCLGCPDSCACASGNCSGCTSECNNK